MLDIFKKSNYEIQIKDASLNLDFPVVCAVIKDIRRNTTTLSFGAHPILPVAIERCLTEFCQGIDLTDPNDTIHPNMYISKCVLEHNLKNNNLEFLSEKIAIHKVYIENCEYIENQFYKNKPQYTYKSNTWINKDKDITNKELLKILLSKINNYTKEIYIRDVSYFGFPSVYIVIPEMSFLKNYNVERLKNKIKLYNWINSNTSKTELSIKSLFETLCLKKNTIFFQDNLVSEFPNEYILLLCSIFLENYKNIKYFTQIILDGNNVSNFFKKDFIKRIEITKRFYELKEINTPEERIFNILGNEFEKEDIDRFRVFIKYLTAEIILNSIKLCNRTKNRSQQIYNNKEVFDKIMRNINEKLKSKIINQNHLSKVFNEI